MPEYRTICHFIILPWVWSKQRPTMLNSLNNLLKPHWGYLTIIMKNGLKVHQGFTWELR